MSNPRLGYIQAAFERRTGRTLGDWLTEHGPTMTRAAAAEEIGYASPSPLTEFVARYMPLGFSFYRRPAKLSIEQVVEAIARQQGGATWPSIAIEYRCDVHLLKESCRRYKKRIADGLPIVPLPGKKPLLGRADLARAAELRSLGISLDSIATQLGVSRRYISARLVQCERSGVAWISKP